MESRSRTSAKRKPQAERGQRDPARRIKFFRQKPEEVNKGQRMEYIALRSGEKDWTTVAICRVLQVSEAGYYKYRRAKKKPYKYSDLLTIIYSILKEDEENVNYGVKRIFIALKNQHSFKGSYSSIYRICKKNNLLIHYKRRPKGITKADSEAEKAENLIQQDFTAEKPNEKWLTDITEIPCSDGKLYLAPILDCYDACRL